jgi:tRNA dimethylallyltransferase
VTVPIIVICGATATGKSDLAVALARKIDGEIINADSMQLYKGMDIGTAKLTFEERGGITHHLIDRLEITEEASVALYQVEARAIIDGATKPMVIVGGTGLYIKSIIDELNFPDTDPQVRDRLSKEGEERGAKVMHERLAKLDPAAAQAIPMENLRRVVRALEVIELTGKPFTANLPRAGAMRYPQAHQFGLQVEREFLAHRIDMRVKRMWQEGLVEETRGLIDKGLKEGRTARAALGYAQVIRYLDGEINEIEAIEETTIATRAYSKRQETWFSKDSRIEWISEISLEERLAAIQLRLGL